MAVGALLSVLLGWLMVRGMIWGEVTQGLLAFPPQLFILALGTFLASIVLRAWRWYVLLAKDGVRFIRVFVIQNTGIGLNNLSPVRVVSEPVQLALMTRREGVSAATALATLAMEHLMDVLVTALLLGLSVLLMPELHGYTIQMAEVIIFAGISLLVFIVIARGMDFVPGVNRLPFVRRAWEAARTLGKSPLRLLLSFLGTLGHWILAGLSGWIIAHGLNIDVGIAVAVVVFMGSLFFVSAIPSLPGGAITFEAAVVYTLSLFDVRGESALAFAILMHVIMFVPSTLLAVMVLPREGLKMFGTRAPAVPVEPEDGRLV